MLNTTFLSASGHLSVMSDKIETGLFLLDHYKIVDSFGWHSNNSYIGGFSSIHNAIEPTECQTYETRDLLDSLINLSQKVVDNKKRKTEILKWVNKYGLPFVDVELSQAHKCFACPLGRFMNFLFELRDSLLKLEAINKSDMNIFGNAKVDNNPYNAPSISWTTDKLERLICDWLNSSSVLIRTRFENHEPQIFLHAASVLDAAKYQMSLILLTDNGATPKRCICCNSYFLAKRANQKYCSFCSPQKYYARKNRVAKQETFTDPMRKEAQSNNG